MTKINPNPRPLRIAFVGNFAQKKGSQVFAEVVKQFQNQHQWYVFGYVGDLEAFNPISQYITKSVVYADYQLPTLLQENQIDLVLILSIWPETFSKTFFEVVSCAVPFVAFDLGFPVEYLPDWPHFVSHQAGAAGIQTEIEKITLAELSQLKKTLQEVDLSSYQDKAALKFGLVDDLLKKKT